MNVGLKNRSALFGLLLASGVSLSIANADDKSAGFRPGPASSFPNRQVQKDAVLAAAAYTTDEQTKAPFGKLNPYEHGVLPVLLLIENKGSQVLRLEKLRVQYIDSRRRKIDNVPAKDVPYLRAPERPKMNTGPLPGIKFKKKNPLSAIEIDSRSFGARMLTPGESVHGFFYFQADHQPGAMLYVTGIEEATSGKELFYVEIPLDSAR